MTILKYIQKGKVLSHTDYTTPPSTSDINFMSKFTTVGMSREKSWDEANKKEQNLYLHFIISGPVMKMNTHTHTKG